MTAPFLTVRMSSSALSCSLNRRAMSPFRTASFTIGKSRPMTSRSSSRKMLASGSSLALAMTIRDCSSSRTVPGARQTDFGHGRRFNGGCGGDAAVACLWPGKQIRSGKSTERENVRKEIRVPNKFLAFVIANLLRILTRFPYPPFGRNCTCPRFPFLAGLAHVTGSDHVCG